MKKLTKKKSKAGFHSAEPFMRELMKNPRVRAFYEEEKAKTLIAQTVYEARKHAHLTQGELAKKVGTHQSAIARLESSQNERVATMPLLAKIARACGGVFEIGIRFDKGSQASK